MNIGLYGGTFSPVHNGHVRSARLFIEKYGFDRLVIMPAGVPPHKSVTGNVTALERLEMCRLAFSELSDKTAVSDYEINKSGKSYTVETVEYLRRVGSVTVLCGEDMLLSLHTWHRARELMKMCRFAVMLRSSSSRDAVLGRIGELRSEYSAEIDFIDETPLDISSTAVREMISRGEDASPFVPKKALDYIKCHNLYMEPDI